MTTPDDTTFPNLPGLPASPVLDAERPARRRPERRRRRARVAMAAAGLTSAGLIAAAFVPGVVGATPAFGGPPTDLPRWPTLAAVDMGRVLPGANAGGSTRFLAPASGTVQASLPADSPFAVAEIDTFTVTREADDIDASELGPGHRTGPVRSWHSVLTPHAQTTGSGPATVAAGELVEIDLVDRNASTAAASTLTVSTSWGQVQTPVTVFVGAVKASLDSNHLTIPQGRGADVPITVTSLGGPDTDVSFDVYDAIPGITVTSNPLHVPSGQTVRGSVHVAVDRNGPIGDHTYNVADTAFAAAGAADRQTNGLGELGLTVTPLPTVSGSVDLGAVKQAWDDARDQACEVIKDQVGRAVLANLGRTIRDPECSLSPLQMTASQNGNTVTIEADAIGNRIGAHVTTPDGFPSDWDPYFFLFFDVKTSLTVTLPTTLDGTSGIRVNNVDVSLWSKDGLQSHGVTGDIVQAVATAFGYGQAFTPIRIGIGDREQSILDGANNALGRLDPLFANAQALGFSQLHVGLDPNSLVLTLTLD